MLNAGYAESAASSASGASSWTCSAAAMNRGFGGAGSVAPLVFLRGMKAAGATLRHRAACTPTR